MRRAWRLWVALWRRRFSIRWLCSARSAWWRGCGVLWRFSLLVSHWKFVPTKLLRSNRLRTLVARPPQLLRGRIRKNFRMSCVRRRAGGGYVHADINRNLHRGQTGGVVAGLVAQRYGKSYGADGGVVVCDHAELQSYAAGIHVEAFGRK